MRIKDHQKADGEITDMDILMPLEDSALLNSLVGSRADWTVDCLSTDDLAELLKRGSRHPRSAEFYAHIAGCDYCAHHLGVLSEAAADCPKKKLLFAQLSPEHLKRWLLPSIGSLAALLAVVLIQSRSANNKLHSEIARLESKRSALNGAVVNNELLKQQHERLAQNEKALQDKLEKLEKSKGATSGNLSESEIVQSALSGGLHPTLPQGDFSRSMGVDAPSIRASAPDDGVYHVDRPVFQWSSWGTPSTKAPYRVTVMELLPKRDDDVGGVRRRRLVVTSPETTATQWQCSTTLKLDTDYTWQVEALTGGKNPVSSSIVFRIIPESISRKLLRDEETLHLALGIVYSRRGKFENAEREFRSVLKTNPSSKEAANLLSQLQQSRRP